MTMETNLGLKQRLARMFQTSIFLRPSCSSTTSSSILSSTTPATTTSSRTLSTDITTHDSLSIHQDCSFVLDKCIVANEEVRKKNERRLKERGGCYETCKRTEGRICPPVDPSNPFKNYYQVEEKKDKVRIKNKKFLSNGYGFSSSSSTESNDELKVEDKEEIDTFFSSKTFSFDSSEFYQRPSSTTKKKKKKKKQKEFKCSRQPRRNVRDGDKTGFPVMKNSIDPFVDFRSSMLEMIIEREIFGAQELELLLYAYLSLNSPQHHSVILRAFADTSEVLFGL